MIRFAHFAAPLLLVASSSCGAQGEDGQKPAADQSGAPAARVFRQPLPEGQGLLTDDQTLRGLEQSLRGGFAQSLEVPIDLVQVSARPLELSSKRFIYVAIALDEELRSGFLISPIGGELVRVVCASGTKAPAKFKGTECAQVAESTFGVSLASTGEDI